LILEADPSQGVANIDRLFIFFDIKKDFSITGAILLFSMSYAYLMTIQLTPHQRRQLYIKIKSEAKKLKK
jgi:hypothetical protein